MDPRGSAAIDPRFDRDEIFRRLVQSVHDYAIFMLTPEGLVATWNAGAQRLKGYAPHEIIGRHFSAFYPQEAIDRGWPDEELRRAVAQGRFEDEGWRLRQDGTRFWANVVITPVHGEAGELLGFSKVTRDLTERLRIEQLEAEGQNIQQFIAMLSHELRNPLAPIGNAVRVLKKKAESHETLWCADLIDRQLGQLTRLVEDLLDIGRITQGKIELRTAPLELNTWAQLAVESARSVVEDHGHTLLLQPAPRPAFVEADAARLTQVLGNLLANAAKYTPPGGRIVVSLGCDHATATIRVVDNGIGMSESLMQRAFDPFVQGVRTLDRAEGGLGIGLTLVKRLVDLHHGAVGVASAGPNQGACFTVTLPLGTVAAGTVESSGTPPPAQAPAAAAARHTVLVVDDNRDAAESLAMLLRMEGHEVRIAHDGPQALEIALRERPRVVLLDIGLPGMDGYEVARRMRASAALQTTRLIALTGYGQPGDRQASQQAGFDGHLVKPVAVDELNRWMAD